jgi:hypothetical protein
MDAAVFRAALTANRDRGRAASEIEIELLFEGFPEFLALEVGEELLERGPK